MTSRWNSSLLSVSVEPSLPAYALNWDTSTPIAASIVSQEDSIFGPEKDKKWQMLFDHNTTKNFKMQLLNDTDPMARITSGNTKETHQLRYVCE